MVIPEFGNPCLNSTQYWAIVSSDTSKDNYVREEFYHGSVLVPDSSVVRVPACKTEDTDLG